jgi:hypothetical protein
LSATAPEPSKASESASCNASSPSQPPSPSTTNWAAPATHSSTTAHDPRGIDHLGRAPVQQPSSEAAREKAAGRQRRSSEGRVPVKTERAPKAARRLAHPIDTELKPVGPIGRLIKTDRGSEDARSVSYPDETMRLACGRAARPSTPGERPASIRQMTRLGPPLEATRHLLGELDAGTTSNTS